MPFYIGPFLFKSVKFFGNAINANQNAHLKVTCSLPSFRSFANTSSLFLNKSVLSAASSLACLEIRSINEEAINSSLNRIYSLKVFYFLFYRRRYILLVSELI